MKIGITMRVVKNSTYPEIRDALSSEWLQFISHHWPEALIVLLPNDKQVALRLIDEVGLDTILFSNGNDIGSAPLRDETERKVLEVCIEKNIKVLGVCRGFQFINSFFSGTVIENIHDKGMENHVACNHAITIKGNHFLGLSAQPQIEVNSYHNHGITESTLAKELKVFALSGDGIVEGFVHDRYPIVGIEWHPERVSPSSSFDYAFIDKLITEGAFWLTEKEKE